MVRAALGLNHRALPVCLGFGPLLSSLLLLIAGFPAVGDFGQELADAFDVIVGPDVDGSLTMLDAFRSRDFPDPYVIGKSFMTNPEPLSRSTS